MQNFPPRNHTGPDCPALQSAVSNSGCSVAGNESAHCHHLADHSPYVLPYGLAPGGVTKRLLVLVRFERLKPEGR